MERRLSEAALKGSVESLFQLLQEDPLVLHRTIISSISETPLHISSLLGHTQFVHQLLGLIPEMAAELDSQGCSPLHLASAKGHVEIVKALLLAAPAMGMVRNFDGRTALHLAVIKGRVGVVTELVRGNTEWTRILTDIGETVLHLCVKFNRLVVLQLLVELAKKDVSELVNWKDCDGNCVLHIAVHKKQIETIMFLFTFHGLEVNSLNANGSTAMDILKRSPRDLRDGEISDSLRIAGAVSAKDLYLITNNLGPPEVPRITKHLSSKTTSSKKPTRQHTDWLGRKRSALMVVASLIATVAFQAGLTPPGGVFQDDNKTDSEGNPVSIGTSVLAYREPLVYGQFMVFNTIAFLASLSIILLLVSGLPMKQRWTWVQMATMWIAITAQVMTYFLSLRHMSPKRDEVQSTLRRVTEISVLSWLSLMAVIFVGNVIRMNLWILRKRGCIPQKERGSPVAIEEEYEEI